MSQIPSIPAGTAGADLVTAINDRIRRINLLPLGSTATVTNTTVIKTGGGAAAAGDVNYGTHAQRLGAPIAAFADGAVWYETDRTVWYQVQIGGWRWIDGVYTCTQAALPTDLGVGDAGLPARVSDYEHVLAWSGSGWTAGPGWDSPGQIRGFMVDPSPTTGWKLCDGLGDDGSAIGVAHPVKYLKSDGTLGSITSATVAPCVPNLTGTPSFLQFGATAAGTAAAVAPSLTMDSYTPGGTIAWPAGVPTVAWPAGVPAFTGAALGTHQHEIPLGNAGGNNHWIFGVGLYGTGTSHTVSGFTGTGGGNATSQATELTQAVSAGTPSGTIAWPAGVPTVAWPAGVPAFTGSGAVLTGAVSSTGTPPRVTLRPWFRK